ncbi:MAG: glycosyltransferase [Patescibacteria group bacterium]|mgnify:CR=1 FL=1
MKFAYVNTQNIFPHDIHLIDGLRQLGHEVNEICEKGTGIKKYLNLARKIRTYNKSVNAIFVGYTSPLFVPIVKLMSQHPIIFNAASSQYEANVVSREEESFGIFKTIKWLAIDFFSFHFSDKILLESNEQIKYIKKTFFVSKKKLIRSWTGLNESEFFFDSSITKRVDFTVLFRGRFLPESGILTVIQAAKILENQDIKFLIIGHGYLYRKVNAMMAELSPKNLQMLNNKLSIQELRNLMLSCHISLGQLANHPRLDRTLPCKLFESLALKLPYLTGRNKAALKLLTENKSCICVNPGDEQDLAKKILEMRNNPIRLETIGNSGYELYKNELTSKKLAEKIIAECFKK